MPLAMVIGGGLTVLFPALALACGPTGTPLMAAASQPASVHEVARDGQAQAHHAEANPRKPETAILGQHRDRAKHQGEFDTEFRQIVAVPLVMELMAFLHCFS